MIVLADGLSGDGPTKILIDGLLRGLVLIWPVVAIVGVLVTLPVVVRIFRYRRLARSGIKDIDRFGGKTFEEYLAVLFKRLGYKVERTKFAGDYGGDLVLRKDGVRTVVQAKRYTKSVGVRAVQEVVAAKGYYDCAQSMVVSNSSYTKQARELASKNNVELWDRDMLIRQLTTTGAKQAVRRAAVAHSIET
jgi:restriction system protein